ncbi:MAG: hypothetical protein VYA84_00730 [Planctomycetota bacterium]|nr:hypothetical protein [Planctomycetota bacterium]
MAVPITDRFLYQLQPMRRTIAFIAANYFGGLNTPIAVFEK